MGNIDAGFARTLAAPDTLFWREMNAVGAAGHIETENLGNSADEGVGIGQSKTAGRLQRAARRSIQDDGYFGITIGLLDQHSKRNRTIFDPARRPACVIHLA